MLSPGVEGANKTATAKMMANNLLGLVSALVVAPVLGNLKTTGTWHGREGVPVGAWDTGKTGPDGEPVYIDVAQLYLVRRGLRISGANAVVSDLQKGKSLKEAAIHGGLDIAKVCKKISWNKKCGRGGS